MAECKTFLGSLAQNLLRPPLPSCPAPIGHLAVGCKTTHSCTPKPVLTGIGVQKGPFRTPSQSFCRSRAIGPGTGSDNYGTLTLGENMMVSSERMANVDGRKNMCRKKITFLRQFYAVSDV